MRSSLLPEHNIVFFTGPLFSNGNKNVRFAWKRRERPPCSRKTTVRLGTRGADNSPHTKCSRCRSHWPLGAAGNGELHRPLLRLQRHRSPWLSFAKSSCPNPGCEYARSDIWTGDGRSGVTALAQVKLMAPTHSERKPRFLG